MGFPTLPRPSAVATLERADGLWIALGSGSHVWITRAETSIVHFLEPIATAESKVTAAVSCLAFCRTSELLAVGAGAAVALYEPSVDLWKPSTVLPHADAVSTLTWATDELSTGSPHRARVLWVAGKQLARWRSAGRGAEWAHTWSCTLSQPARLMSASVDGAMLATAGPNDKLVKVWQQSTSGSSDGFDFYYLRHPGALLSLEWRPTERQPAGAASMRTGSSGSGLGAASTSEDSAFLLTLCADGVPRLWRATMSSEPGPRRMFLCAVFSMDGCSNLDETSLQLVTWLPPTTRPAFPRASPRSDDTGGLFELDQGRLSPRVRPPRSPLLTPGPGVPILKPSLRDRHDYLIGQLADGTLVVWLLLGLSTERRCSPKLMVWATLPHRLPAVAGVQSGAAFCNMASADQLPSTISVVQHTRGISSQVRLCSIDVERATNHEGVHLLQLLGHGPGQAGEIVSLKPHPVSSLAASLSAEGELLLWHSPTFSWHDGAKGGRNSGLRDAPRAPHATPTCLMYFPERYEVIVWVPASATESASLIALRADRACLFGRNSIGDWNISCSVPILFAEATTAGVHALAPGRRWICAHALAKKARSEASGIAFQAERAAALVLTVSEGHSIRVRGHVSLERESSPSPVRCSAPLVAATWEDSVGTSLPMGAFICGHEDGTICMWSLDETTMGLSASLRGVIQPAPSVEVCSVATSCVAYFSRAAVVLGSPVEGSTFRMQVLEFESCAPSMRVEFESEISSPYRTEERKRTPSCAIFAGACGMHIVAVSNTNEVTFYVQRGPREHDTKSARWAPLQRTALPGHLPCTALAWTVSGSLLVGSCGVFFTFPEHFETATCKSGTLPQWHPIALRQQLLVQPERCHRVLRHLSEQPQLAQALPLDLAELLSNDDGVPGRSLLNPAKKTRKLSAPIEDIFAPSSSSSTTDMFAPTQMAPDFLAAQPTSLLISGSAGGCALASKKAAARLLERLEGKKHHCMPHLSMAEEEDLVRLLRAQKAIDAAGPAIDACGARFVLCALERPHDAPTRPLSSMAVAWAMLSDCHTTLLEVSCAHTQGSDRDWAALRALGVGFWLPNGDTLRAALEAAAKVQFMKKKEALDCALLYIALGKTKQLQALSKATKNDRLATFLANDFTDERWLSAARKNAFSVLCKQQFEFAIALFLLGGDLDSAVNVCARQLKDVQLALVLCRLHLSAGAETMGDLVRREVLADALSRGDHWLCSISYVLLSEPDKALEALEMQSNDRGDSMPSTCGLERLDLNPCAAAFCAQLIASPRWRLKLRRPGPSVFLLSAYSLATTGCWLHALETLLNGKPVETHNAHVRSSCQDLALRYLADRSSDLCGSVTAMSISTMTKALLEARTVLVQEAHVLGSHIGISVASIKVLAVVQLAIADPVHFLPSLALTASLRMWECCTNLIESTLHTVEQRLSCVMPHEQSDSSAWLSNARSSLLAACSFLESTAHDVPTFDALGSLAMRIRDAAHHAAYAIACSHNDFYSVLEVLRGCFTNEIGSSKPPDLLRTTSAVSRSSSEVAYVWIRFHLSALPLLCRHSFERYAGNADSSHELRVATRSAHDRPQLLDHWLQLLRLRSRETVRHLSESSFPLDPAALCARGSTEMSNALADSWNLVREHHDQLRPLDHQSASPYGVWFLENEQPEQTSKHLPRSIALGLSLGDPLELLHRKGEFIRALCENALNPCQITVALGSGVLQLELSEKPGGNGINVAHSNVCNNYVARCLCAHPKLPLYLAGGESIVQCWQFDQGQGLNDHLRAQYKLPAGGNVANIRISPLCSEQFATIDEEGFVSLWRFQSGGEMPLPYNRMQCHMKRGSDICFVDSSVILASVGLSPGVGGNSLCLWDVLLPPSQALVACCAAHPEGGRCVVHCTADNSLISGGDRGEVVIFDLRQRKVRECWRAHPTAVQALTLAQGRLAFSADLAGSMKLWDVSCPCVLSTDDVYADGRPIGEWRAVGEQGSLFGTKGGVHSLLFSSTSRFLLSGGRDGRLQQWPIV